MGGNGGGQFGRRWSGAHHHSDIDSDYRREMATANGTGSTIGGTSNAPSGISLHNEARGRGGSRLNLIPPPDETDAMMMDQLGDVDQIGQGDNHSRSQGGIEKSPSTTREEERRKVLEIEEERIRRERSNPQLARRPISRSASRATSAGAAGRTAHVQPAGPRGFRPARHLVPDLDHDSQYSGHSSSSAIMQKNHNNLLANGVNKMSRFDQHRVGVGRVKRSTSSANTNNGNGVVLGNAAAMHGARREINRKKMPGSLTSSINSSESEQGGAPPSAISRATSAQSAGNRSVFLHAAAVADIPCAGDRPPMANINTHANKATTKPAPGAATTHVRALSADSRRDVNLAAKAGALNAKPDTNANLKGSKKVSRSISMLAPWSRQRGQQKENLEIHYDNSAVYSQAPATSVTVGKPPRPPQGGIGPGSSITVSSARPNGSILRNEKSKSASSHDLLHENDVTDASVIMEPEMNNGAASVISGPVRMMANHRRPPVQHSPPSVLVANQQRAKTLPAKGVNGKVSRSMSMPKDTRISGWFKKKKRF